MVQRFVCLSVAMMISQGEGYEAQVYMTPALDYSITVTYFV